jgi:hypothetical protein
MLQRIANLILGAVILTMAGGAIVLQAVSGEPTQPLAFALAAALVGGAGVCFWAASVIGSRSKPHGPVVPAAGSEAAWRLRELKRNAPQRYLGLKGLSSLAPWKL